MTVATMPDLQAATVRLARARVAEADGATILGMCQGANCGVVPEWKHVYLADSR